MLYLLIACMFTDKASVLLKMEENNDGYIFMFNDFILFNCCLLHWLGGYVLSVTQSVLHICHSAFLGGKSLFWSMMCIQDNLSAAVFCCIGWKSMYYLGHSLHCIFTIQHLWRERKFIVLVNGLYKR